MFSPAMHEDFSLISIISLTIISFAYYHWFCT